ncbi:bZIP Maf transcription factor, partial [Ostertagia ostertagi]
TVYRMYCNHIAVCRAFFETVGPSENCDDIFGTLCLIAQNNPAGHDRQLVTMMKQKRRTLKNRGYALNCRVRRIQNQLQLEADNIQLRDQISRSSSDASECKTT